jgi:fatty acid desaturase
LIHGEFAITVSRDILLDETKELINFFHAPYLFESKKKKKLTTMLASLSALSAAILAAVAAFLSAFSLSFWSFLKAFLVIGLPSSLLVAKEMSF